MPKTEPDEKAMARVLRAFVTTMEQDDYGWVYARFALNGIPTPADRAAIKALRERDLLCMHRGGLNEDGDMVGGTGYAPTRAGKLWLAEIEKQQELPL